MVFQRFRLNQPVFMAVTGPPRCFSHQVFEVFDASLAVSTRCAVPGHALAAVDGSYIYIYMYICIYIYIYLVGGLEHFLFFHILGIIIHIFQRGRLNHQPESIYSAR